MGVLAKTYKQTVADTDVEKLVYMLLVAATVFVFGKVSEFGGVNFDDPFYFKENRSIRMGLTPESIAWAFTDGIATTDYWAPTTLFSLLAGSEIYGLNAGGYLATNLFLHIANTRIHMDIGTFVMEAGDIPAAIRSFATELQTDPQTPRMYNNIGNAYLQLNDPPKARAHFQKALQDQPFDAQAHSGPGAALQLQGRVMKAQHHFETALSIRPGYQSARHNLEWITGK